MWNISWTRDYYLGKPGNTAPELRKATAQRPTRRYQAVVLARKVSHAPFGFEPITIASNRKESLGIATKRHTSPYRVPCQIFAKSGERGQLL